MLLSLVGFPPSLPFNTPTPQQFALQLWDVPQKHANVSLAVGIIGLLARHAGVSGHDVIPASLELTSAGYSLQTGSR